MRESENYFGTTRSSALFYQSRIACLDTTLEVNTRSKLFSQTLTLKLQSSLTEPYLGMVHPNWISFSYRNSYVSHI